MAGFVDEFEGDALDADVWLPHYLPHWSSRAETAATYVVADSALRLSIPTDQRLWCPDQHAEPLRVSGVQSGVFSGPVGSTRGQQPFLDGQTVREEQGAWWGWMPFRERIEVTARMGLSPRSMASVWLVGLEDEPERCGEICVFEVFGRTIVGGTAGIGAGVHPFRDPALVDDFAVSDLPIDVGEWHTYALDWTDEGVDVSVDGSLLRSVPQSPDYPMQVIVAVFDFSDWPTDDPGHVPWLEVDRVVGGSGQPA